MAGKGSKLRKGANWNNFPLEERNTVTYWKNKMGCTVPDIVFDDIPTGKRITEDEYFRLVDSYVAEELTDEDVQQLKDDMNSMSFSEFAKFKSH